MISECRQFRARLADALRGPRRAAQEPALGGLAWHAHVIHCGACRELLAEEEALDELLRSLPQPHLPRALCERVLSRLDEARRAPTGDLDRLLELTPAEVVPANLAERVLSRVHAEVLLDRLLDRAPLPSVPAGLEQRVLARLQLARRVGVASRAGVLVSSTPVARRMPLRLAAGFAIVGLASWALWKMLPSNGGPTQPPLPTPDVAHNAGAGAVPLIVTPVVEPSTAAQPDELLLASLDMAEAWDLLRGSDGLDVALATLDPLDEYLLEFEASDARLDAAPAGETPRAPEPSAPSAPAEARKDEERQG
jgi:hypothetical protein